MASFLFYVPSFDVTAYFPVVLQIMVNCKTAACTSNEDIAANLTYPSRISSLVHLLENCEIIRGKTPRSSVACKIILLNKRTRWTNLFNTTWFFYKVIVYIYKEWVRKKISISFVSSYIKLNLHEISLCSLIGKSLSKLIILREP